MFSFQDFHLEIRNVSPEDCISYNKHSGSEDVQPQHHRANYAGFCTKLPPAAEQ